MPPKRTRKQDAVDVDAETPTAVDVDAVSASAGLLAPLSKSSLNLQQYLVEDGWLKALEPQFSKPYFRALEAALEKEYVRGAQIFPPKDLIFAAFNRTPLSDLRVVLLGQDPYHDDNQAHGMCFSVSPGVKVPPSLVNMYKELETDIPGFKRPAHGTLTAWAQQGVLLLNATLTVEAHKANSHAKLGWQTFTDNVISYVNANCVGVVFLLWGGFAQKKIKMIDQAKHRVVAVAHPSPLSAKHWFGCKTFSKCNGFLSELGKTPIDWSLPEKAAL